MAAFLTMIWVDFSVILNEGKWNWKAFWISTAQFCHKISPNMVSNEFWHLYAHIETLRNIPGAVVFSLGDYNITLFDAKIFKFLAFWFLKNYNFSTTWTICISTNAKIILKSYFSLKKTNFYEIFWKNWT